MQFFKASQSRVNLWRKCHYAHHLRYNEKLRRRSIARPLMFGRIVHQMIEESINGKNPFNVLRNLERTQGRMFRSEREEYGDILDDARVIMKEYFDFWERRPVKYIKVGNKRSEISFEVEVDKGILATGKIDGIAEFNRLRWLAEHKSGRNIPNEDHRWRNLQSVLYIRILEMLRLPAVDGTMWDYIRSKSPAVPKFLKSGSISQRGLDTLPTRVIDALKSEGANPKKFLTLLRSAESNRQNYFARIFTPVKARVVDEVFEDFIDTAKEIADCEGDKKDRNIGRHCEYCDYESLCRATLQGLDVGFVRKREYEKAPHYEAEAPDLEG